MKLRRIPTDLMNSDMASREIVILLSQINNAKETQTDIDFIYQNLCDVVTEEVAHSIPTFIGKKTL